MWILLLYLIWFAFPLWIRKQAGKRVAWRCEWDGCNRSFGKGWMVEVDHIIPVHKGGSDHVSNAQVLCMWHHYRKHIIAKEWGAARLVKSRIKSKGLHTHWWK